MHIFLSSLMSDNSSNEELGPKRHWQWTGKGSMPATAHEADPIVIFLNEEFTQANEPKEPRTEVPTPNYEEEKGPDIPSDEEPENYEPGQRGWQWQ